MRITRRKVQRFLFDLCFAALPAGTLRNCLQHASHPKTRALAVEFLHDWDAIFRVLERPAWPLTNHEAERAPRHGR
ncbi:MAG: hypothetical protein ACRER2_08260 [Methylococcales bacterium]